MAQRHALSPRWLCTIPGDSEGPVWPGAEGFAAPSAFPPANSLLFPCSCPAGLLSAACANYNAVGKLGMTSDSPGSCARLPPPRPCHTRVWWAGDGNKIRAVPSERGDGIAAHVLALVLMAGLRV